MDGPNNVLRTALPARRAGEQRLGSYIFIPALPIELMARSTQINTDKIHL